MLSLTLLLEAAVGEADTPTNMGLGPSIPDESRNFAWKDYGILNTEAHRELKEYLQKHPKDMYHFENLVLEGGGVKGFSYCGAVKVGQHMSYQNEWIYLFSGGHHPVN